MKLRNILISLMMIISLSACEGEIELNGAVFEFDRNTFKPLNVEIIKIKGDIK